MRFLTSLFTVMAGLVMPACAVKIITIGDSTMSYKSKGPKQGWGVLFPQYFSIPVVNLGRSGSSARTATRDGYFAEMLVHVVPGDFVVIEFGHNDWGDPLTNSRSSTTGDGNQTTSVKRPNGSIEIVQTFVTYFKWAIRDVLAKGGIPVVSSMTPYGDAWNKEKTRMGEPKRFVPYAAMAAGNYSSQGATYIDHYKFVKWHWEELGYANVYPKLYPVDNIHTDDIGADYVAQAFISGILCGKHDMAKYLNLAGKALTPICAPPGISINETPTVPNKGETALNTLATVTKTGATISKTGATVPGLVTVTTTPISEATDPDLDTTDSNSDATDPTTGVTISADGQYLETGYTGKMVCFIGIMIIIYTAWRACRSRRNWNLTPGARHAFNLLSSTR